MSTDKQALFRKIPSVDRLLQVPSIEEASGSYPRALLLRAIHQVLDELRSRIRKGEVESEEALGLEAVSGKALQRAEALSRPSLRPLINATGVIVHTNLGRSILSQRALDKFDAVAGGYSNLEYDLERGARGSRYTHVAHILKELTGAEAAMVVNNNAAAVLISLETLAAGREVIVSHGELVEIGGSFRMPDVMRKSGARMVGVGTTNKTHLRDYEDAITEETGLLLKVHKSNFQIVGFTEEVALSELVKLGRKHGIPVMEDLGSGCLVDFSKYGIRKEPTVQESLAQGVDVVTFSGDKMLGGPQAGIILGRESAVEAVKKNPMNRAMRIDKLTLAALEETLRSYRDEDSAVSEIPTLRMITQPYGAIKEKAERLVKMVGEPKTENFSLELCDGISRVGGGALPLLELPTCLVCLVPGRMSSHQMETRLRSHEPPIISRVEKERLLLDVRTVQEREMATLSRALTDLARLE